MITHKDKINELKRELALRRALFPRWVKDGRLDQEEANRRIEILEEIFADYVNSRQSNKANCCQCENKQ